MTTPPLDARIKFTPSTNASRDTSRHNGAQASQLPLIKIHGKTFQVDYVRMQVNGTWQDVTLSQRELSALADRCRDIYEKVVKTADASTIHFNFEKAYHSEKWLGKVLDRWKATPHPLELKTIEYKTAANPKSKVVELKAEDKAKIDAEVQAIDEITLKVFNNHEQYLKPIPKKLSSEQTTLKKLVQESIQDAGSAGNRCAALSTAKRELTPPGASPETIVGKYKLDESLIAKLKAAKEGQERIQILAEALVQKAAAIIGSQEETTNPFLKLNSDQRGPCLAAVKTALEDHKKANPAFVIPSDPKAAVAAYAHLIRQPGTMLDLPFFLALDVPFMIIRNDQDNNPVITEISENFEISGTIDSYDLNRPNILFYNGVNHYQALILQDDSHREAIRKLLKQTIDEEITTFVNALGHDGLTAHHIKAYTSFFEAMEKRFQQAREAIIQKMQNRYPLIGEIETLKTIPAKQFVEAALRRMGKTVS
jgi:hypothetical protein